jgi:putative redox protein
VAHASADIGSSDYEVSLRAGQHRLTADEGVAAGGQDRGPAPHELLCAALAACTAITLRMYAQRGLVLPALPRRTAAAAGRGALDTRTLSWRNLDKQRARSPTSPAHPVTLTLAGCKVTTDSHPRRRRRACLRHRRKRVPADSAAVGEFAAPPPQLKESLGVARAEHANR